MSLVDTRRDQLFPRLSVAQIDVARRFASHDPYAVAAGDPVWRQGERNAPAFLVLAGEVVVRGGEDGVEITRHRAGEMTGEVSQLSGRAALAGGTAGSGGAQVLPFDAAHLRALLIGSADLGELLMRAFILRRTALITEGGAGTVLVGRPGSPPLARLESFLSRNGHPYKVIDAEGSELAARLGLSEADLPIAVTPGGEVLRRPGEGAIAAAVGITPELEPGRLHDVAIVGAGPAGLAAATYAASEGLSVLVLEARAFGGQAGASARIENYLGFPTGITGQALMGRAFTQAQKFGAEVAAPLCVERLDCGGRDRAPGSPFALHLHDGGTVSARSVVIASGARYRRPAIANLADFEGAGVSYWASPVEAKLCAGEEVALVGAGNSAGQAVVFLAPKVAKLHLVVRGEGLEASMSKYLVDRIAALPNVEIHVRTEVAALAGDATTGLASATFTCRDTGASWTGPLRHIFLFIGADPNTAWLDGCGVEVDPKGFVITGRSPDRPFLETSVPGIFAIGDVRAGSVKRVGGAIGEGAAVVAALHGVLG